MRTLDEMKRDWQRVCDLQHDLGDEYKRKASELEAEYHTQIIDTHKKLYKTLQEMTKAKGEKMKHLIIRYHNVYGQECDMGAVWLSQEEPRIGAHVSCWNNVVHCIGMFDGVITEIYDEPIDSEELNSNNIACPYNYRPIWTIERRSEE